MKATLIAVLICCCNFNNKSSGKFLLIKLTGQKTPEKIHYSLKPGKKTLFSFVIIKRIKTNQKVPKNKK